MIIDRGRGWTIVCTLVMSGLVTKEAAAQDGWYHVDADHPLRVEDAYALKFNEWEWQLGSEGATGGASAFAGILELKTGLLPNLQLGAEVHAENAAHDGNRESGLEEISAHLLYNLNREGRRSPALALRVDTHFPGTGEVGRDQVGVRTALLATRTLSGFRTHINVARRFEDSDEQDDAWEVGVALERALGFSGRSLLADVFAEIPVSEGRARVWLDVGSRLQVTRKSVLAIGLFTRLDRIGEGESRAGLRLGWTRSFGFSWLTSVPDYREPRLR